MGSPKVKTLSRKVKRSLQAVQAARRSSRRLSSAGAGKSTPEPFRLLDLPGELRNMVYKELLVQPENIPWTHPLPEFFQGQGLSIHCVADENDLLAISRTCKQLKFETLSIYYGHNKFSFPNTNELEMFLRIRKAPKLYVRNISYIMTTFDVDTFASVTKANKVTRNAITLLSECEQLKELSVELKHIRKPKYTDCNLITRAGVQELRKVRGLEVFNVTHMVPYWLKPPNHFYASFNQDEVDYFTELVGEEVCRPRDSPIDARKKEKKRKKEPDERWVRSLRSRTSL